MSITEIELIKSYVRDYFANLDNRIKDQLDDGGNQRSKTPNTTHTGASNRQQILFNQNQKVNTFVKEYFQVIYKIWSAFTKAIRAIVIKNHEDMVVNTLYFGKIYLTQLEESTNTKLIIYQPPANLQSSCKNVIRDQSTLSYGDIPDLSASLGRENVKFKEVKLNFMAIAKACNQSITNVEKSLSDLCQHLTQMIMQSNENKIKVRLNLKIGQLNIVNKILQFIQEPYQNLINIQTLNKSFFSNFDQSRAKSVHKQTDEGIDIQDQQASTRDSKPIFDKINKTQRMSVNSETLGLLLQGDKRLVNKPAFFQSRDKTNLPSTQQYNSPLINSLNKQVSRELDRQSQYGGISQVKNSNSIFSNNRGDLKTRQSYTSSQNFAQRRSMTMSRQKTRKSTNQYLLNQTSDCAGAKMNSVNPEGSNKNDVDVFPKASNILNRSFQNYSTQVYNRNPDAKSSIHLTQNLLSQLQEKSPQKVEQPQQVDAQTSSYHTHKSQGSFNQSAGSAAFHKQLINMSYNRDFVFQNALERYKGMVHQKESEMKNDLDHHFKVIDDFQRHQEYLRQRKRLIQENNQKYLQSQAREKKGREQMHKEFLKGITAQETHFGPQEDDSYLNQMRMSTERLRSEYKEGLIYQLQSKREFKQIKQVNEQEKDKKLANDLEELHKQDIELKKKRVKDNQKICKDFWQEQMSLKQKHKQLQGYLY